MNGTPPMWTDAGRDHDEMGCIVGDLGQIGLKLPGTGWVLVIGPGLARALSVTLRTAADEADDVIAGLIAGSN